MALSRVVEHCSGLYRVLLAVGDLQGVAGTLLKKKKSSST